MHMNMNMNMHIHIPLLVTWYYYRDVMPSLQYTCVLYVYCMFFRRLYTIASTLLGIYNVYPIFFSFTSIMYIQVIRMLLVICLLFAVLWLPYRGISLYNGFAAKPIYNKWLMLFAKTCIFLNSSINPILYNGKVK